jgi:hypothetical protein
MSEIQTRGGVHVEQSIKTASFSISPDNWMHKAVLTEVFYQGKAGTGDNEGTTYDTINFVFRGVEFITEGDNPHVPRFQLTLFAVLNASKSGRSVEDRIKDQDKIIAQIFDVYAGIGKHAAINNGKGLGAVEGKPSATWQEFYESVANSFNTIKKGEALYKTVDGKYIPIWLKLTYSPTGETQVPIGNFIDVIREGKNTLLRKGSDSQYIAPNRERRSVSGGAAAANAAINDLPDGFK